ncbi:hypothetical protein Afil01_63670 [Actinorhabdospora filicis]|uniref:HTH luxR-type domain-containing protein n=1 Tax=Actinorhabdospora filicis TaxID=1785913 RepID=A0A9W6WE62_9ACTN|nr:LuxR family transcriptional regulator [Actinorhabdospora filicis]GLZ81560.1 hypothetical protein Afil01_63670 [Actinorhabdospora filicis]
MAKLIGRDVELSTVDAVLAAGGPAALTIAGEAGIGKSALWRHAMEAARGRGFGVLSCRAAEAEVRLSFGGLVDLLRPVNGDVLSFLPVPQRDALECALLRRQGEGEVDRRAVYLAVLGVIRTLSRWNPVVIGVDDAQWLDEPTRAALEYTVRRLTGERVVVIAAVRGDADEAPFGAGEALGDARAPMLRLGGIDAGALHRLLRERTGRSWPRPVLTRLHASTGGNPFYALEMARAMDRSGKGAAGEVVPLPPTLTQAVRDRIDALEPPTREALLYAAAMPQPELSGLRTVLPGDGMAALQDAEDSGVVDFDRGAVRFTHPLLASTVYAAAAPGERRRVHAKLAASAADDEARAWHLALSATGPDERIAAALEEASARALGRGAPTTAADMLDLAARHAPEPDRSRLLAAAAERVFFAGDAAGARSRYEAALAVAPAGPERVRILLDLALAVFYADGPEHAGPLCDRAIEEAEGPAAAVAYLRKAWYRLDDHRARAGDARRALELLDTAAPPDLLALALLTAAWFGFHAGLGFDPADVARARAVLPPESRTREASMSRNVLRVFPRYLDPVAGRAEIEAARAAAAEVGDESGAMQSLVHRGELDCWLGAWEAAREGAGRAVETAEQIGQLPWRPYARYVLAQATALLGDLDGADAIADAGLTESDAWVELHLLGVRGFTALSRGEAEEADRWLTRLADLCASIGLAEPGVCGPAADHVEAVTILGDLERAQLLLDGLEERARRAPRPWLAAVLHRSRAVVATGRGDLATAAEEAALALAVDVPMPFEHARAHLAMARVRRRAKEKLAARDALLAARKGFEELGAVRWVAITDEELHRLGLRRGTEHDLTPTEERIAELVAGGMSNREVAAALFVTPKTVEAHLGRVYRKLGIRTRRDLARVLREP